MFSKDAPSHSAIALPYTPIQTFADDVARVAVVGVEVFVKVLGLLVSRLLLFLSSKNSILVFGCPTCRLVPLSLEGLALFLYL